MAKMSFVLAVLCGLASLAMAEPYGAMPPPAMYPPPAKYEAPTPAPTPAPTKYEAPTPAPTPVKYEAPTPAPAMYEEKKEKYPMKMEHKKMEQPKKMEYGGKKYRRSIEETLMDMDEEPFEDETADAKRRWVSAMQRDASAKRKWWSEEDMDELMHTDAKRGWRWSEDDMEELMDAIRWRPPRPMYPGTNGRCFWRGGRRRCIRM
ncbi:hypothetical protein GHT06_015951 [Daphnia sinensis]|uniref:Uncharacterized protein n=1 Tax=Daphnia sinensis TaxID=1820382 RepID=A0AAD5KU68_9CRUS|nr:hypothetical protein GHT06_015951 [Daphnia sinensis]